MKNIIHIYGASGSGTSTLGRKICDKLGYTHMDTDDYFWLPTEPPYVERRSRQERVSLMLKDIEKAENVVISGSLVDWGDELIPLFTLAVRLETAKKIRLERLKRREKQNFGQRIEPDGDMYIEHTKFIKWAASYDTGDVHIRSKAMHDEWQKLLLCEQLLLDGSEPLEKNCEIVISKLK